MDLVIPQANALIIHLEWKAKTIVNGYCNRYEFRNRKDFPKDVRNAARFSGDMARESRAMTDLDDFVCIILFMRPTK